MYGHWKPYVSVAQRRKNAEKAVAKRVKNGENITPVRLPGRTIASTFWGKAWCDHLESLGDYENRLPRGRTYVRNGSVIHLSIDYGKVQALVQGSELYEIQIDMQTLGADKWRDILQKCSGQIASMIELLQGKLSSGVMTTITDQKGGLFPLAEEITLKCSCPDWASMCKHVAAVLYGVGARLDAEPELLFKLRKVDHAELISKVSMQTPAPRSGKNNVIQDQDLSNLFGIDIDGATPPPAGVKQPKKKATANKPVVRVKTRMAVKTRVKTKKKPRTTTTKVKARTKGKAKAKSQVK